VTSCLMAPCLSTDANVFLGSSGSPAFSVEELHRELVEADKGKLDDIQRVLAPMYVTLPKNALGKLDHATVCYALHRYFVQQHGWFINGMAPDGSGWNSSSPTALMQEQAPAHVQDLLEGHLGRRGLSLRELAALASVMNTLVTKQYFGRSESAYRIAGAPIVGRASQDQFKQALKLWMTMLILGPEAPKATGRQVLAASRKMTRYFPAWEELLLWAEDVRQSVTYTRRGLGNPFVAGALPLEAMNAVVSEVPKRFGRWHDTLCAKMKNKLVDLENARGTGRVSLAAFYGGDNPGKDWEFEESVDYLRQLGALDESDRKRPRVIVPNYLIGPNNCIEASDVHTYCCKDECGELVAEVERGIAAPTGHPTDIAEIVSRISSDTVSAPRNLSVELEDKLGAVAKRHGGRVPLHGRLFAQWMHHAFPLECPHPHVSGTTAPMTADKFQNSVANVSVTTSERHHYIAAQASLQALPEGEESLVWSDEEELLTYYDFEPRWEVGNLRSFAVQASLVLLASLVPVTVCTLRSGPTTSGRTKEISSVPEKYMV